MMRKIELLAPAADKNVAREAILHGADAVYMGASSHGARKNASNSIEDIRETVEFAHRFRVRVYVTVNTLVYESEIPAVEKLVRDLYRAGVDALIVQDMSLLRMDIPPIQLHASTQCDTRTPEKAEFLEKVGFSQLVLARELSLDEIRRICSKVTVPVECFVHGALCVSYSGRCQASQKCMGRSANRGECAQMCRLPYTLMNSKGEILLRNRHLLSLSDFNASAKIGELIEAGVTSFKIEGRLKDADYVKNVVASYRLIIDRFIATHPDKYCRSSCGETQLMFEPCLDKSFNRGFTEYFLNGRGDRRMASLVTPKSLGERIKSVKQLHNGDGISFFNPKTGEYEGVRVNKVQDGKIIPARGSRIAPNVELRRTFDIEWQKQLAGNTAVRKILLDVEIDECGLTAKDERGVYVRIPLDAEKTEARKPMDPESIFSKLGNTIYKLRKFENKLSPSTFIPASVLTALRRGLIEEMDKANVAVYPFEYRKKEDIETECFSNVLESRDNVSNNLAERFYRDHGVKEIEMAMEVKSPVSGKLQTVMTTRYCIRRELGCCKKNPVDKALFAKMTEPLSISSGPHKFILEFDCSRCEMNVKI